MKLFIIIIIILIILITLYLINLYINKKVYAEYFTNSYGAVPSNNAWGNYDGDINNVANNNRSGSCTITDPITSQVSYGIMNNNKCYSLTKSDNSDSSSTTNSLLNSNRNSNINSNNVNGLSLTSQSNSLETSQLSSYSIAEPFGATTCYSNNTNFSKICTDQNPNYGVKSITPCSTISSSVECAPYYLGGVDYGAGVTITPCLNKSDDFDTWCRFYTNSSNIPTGYNVNSIGAKYRLTGKSGDCYLDNGSEDTNSARGVCDLNHIEEVKKLDPISDKIDYNIFTDCKLLKGTNFTTECSQALNNPYDQTYADQIMAYDCNPGYGRAKCLKKSDKTTFEEDITYALNTITNQQNAGNVKKCC
jgi:hypothetical protein